MLLKIIIDTDDKQQRAILRKYVPLMRKLLRRFVNLYSADLERRQASLPEKLIFSPLRTKKSGGTSAGKLRFGYAFVSWNDEFNIELNLNMPAPLTKLTLAHEVAHIGEYLLESKMRHRKTWKEIYERLKEPT